MRMQMCVYVYMYCLYMHVESLTFHRARYINMSNNNNNNNNNNINNKLISK